MATITARYAGRCASCGRSFQAGTQIDYRAGVAPGRPGSMASYPYLAATPDGVVYHIAPVYDDDPRVSRLALTVAEAVTAARTAGWTLVAQEG